MRDDTVITTVEYTPPRAAYTRSAITGTLVRLWWIIAIPAAVAAIIAASDIRWAFVALIWIFLVAPLIVANSYITRLLTPAAQRAIMQQRVSISPGTGITITYTDSEHPAAPDFIPWSKISGIYPDGQNILITSDGTGMRSLYIPRKALSPDEIKMLLSCQTTSVDGRLKPTKDDRSSSPTHDF